MGRATLVLRAGIIEWYMTLPRGIRQIEFTERIRLDSGSKRIGPYANIIRNDQLAARGSCNRHNLSVNLDLLP